MIEKLPFLCEVGSELVAEMHQIPLESLCRQMKIVDGPSESPLPLNVGILFFNEHPERFFPVTQIDVVWFPEGAGGDRFEEKVFQGSLGRITRDAISYIQRNYLKETILKHPDRPEAERFWNFPQAAIEEAIVNAVYHRSYEIREPVEVRISCEDIVVLSFPGPDRSIRMADLRRGKAISRRYRNRRIGEFLKELDLTEGRSTGISKMIKAMRGNGSPAPEFETDNEHSYFLIRLPVHEKSTASKSWFELNTKVSDHVSSYFTGHVTPHAADITPHVTPHVTDITPHVAGATDHVTPHATAHVDHVTAHVGRLLGSLIGEMSRAALMDAMGMKDRVHFGTAYLQPALKSGLVEMTQPSKPRSVLQRYRITDAGKQWIAKNGSSANGVGLRGNAYRLAHKTTNQFDGGCAPPNPALFATGAFGGT